MRWHVRERCREYGMRLALVLVSASLLASGCGAIGGGGAKAVKKEPFTIAFAGDTHFEGQIRNRLDADPASVFGPIKDTLSSADLAMVNLETAVTQGGTPASKRFTFRAPSTAFAAL